MPEPRTIIVTVHEEEPLVEIAVEGEQPEFKHWMMAAEFLLATVARKSGVGFERAMELICSGATTYKEIRP